jgi:hypothetical protein
VTVAPEDSGSLRTIDLPLFGTTAAASPMVAGRQSSSVGKKAALAATVVLLLGLGAAAFFVIRGPGRPAETIAAQPSQIATTPEASPAPAQPTAPASEAVVRKPDESSKAQSDAEKAALEKRATEAEKKLAEEKKAVNKNNAKQEAPAPAVLPPAVPEPPKEQPTQSQTNTACVVVSVKGPDGQPVSGIRIGLIEQAGGSFNGRTGPLGRWQTCGLTAGSRVSVGVFGPRGALRGGKQGVLLARGPNFVEIQITKRADRDDDDEPVQGPRRRRFPRQ